VSFKETVMPYQEEEVRELIRQKVRELSFLDKTDKFELKDEDVIPETGYIDSAGIVEFIVWIEVQFNISIKQKEITLEHFGSVNSIIRYLRNVGVLK
jgi:D-alanine--poly(phosphoribitol) ligase subunit 2